MMTSCWRGLGHFLGECVPYPGPHSDVSRRASSGHVAPTPPSPSVSPTPPPSLSRPSTGATIVTSRGSGRVRSSNRARYLVVRPASPRRSRTPSPIRPAAAAVAAQYRRATAPSGTGNFGLYSQRRTSGGNPPFMLLSRGFQLPPIPSAERPSFLYSYGFKCPVCSKLVLADDLECHLVICLTKPRISYNEDILSEDKGECVICFEDLSQGDTIARLPCLCIYHKACIDEWFQVNRSCPGHPYD